MNAHAPPRPVRRQASAWLWLANLALAVAVGVNYLAHLPETPSPKAWLFALPALVSTALLLTLVPGLSFVVLANVLRSTRLLGSVQAACWTVFHILLFVDTRIYNAFRYHFNGQVWNLVYTRGSEDAIHLGSGVWIVIAIGLALGMGLELLAWRSILRRVGRASAAPARRLVLSPMGLVWLGILLPSVFVEKTIYAHSKLTRDRQITHLAQLFPLYPPLPVEGLLGLEREPSPRLELGGLRLDYPPARPAIDPGGARPDIVVVVVDCLRADLLSARHAPRSAAWAATARRFANHVSGGNSTRFGLFSLFYGIHGSYWFPVLAERRAPVLIDSLRELSYEFGIFGSASMDYPELRATCFASIEDSVHDHFPGSEPWQRDEQAATALIDWLAERESSARPAFAFLLLDSPHQTYSHPPDETPFEPSAPALDYLTMTQNGGPTPAELNAVRNRYWNAVHHADDIAGRVLAALDASPRFRNALIVLTGDHGEEFRECGFFGHTSAFTREQVAVPFLLRGPGIEPVLETRPTAHVDVAPTLLELLGANPAGRASWSLGESLLDPPAERRRVLGGWNELGVWTPEAILRIPLSTFDFDVEAYDYSWRLLVDDAGILREETPTLERLAAECHRFLRR